MIDASINPNCHMGDKIMCCLTLDNYAKINKIELSISGCVLTKKICEKFNLKNLKFIESNLKINYNQSIKNFFSFLKNTQVKCFNHKYIFLNKLLKPKIIETFQSPEFGSVALEDVTFFQLDSRSKHEFKKQLKKQEQIRLIKLFAKFEPIGLGGEETKKILAYKYFLGNFDQIVESIKKSKQFVGVDSGISHIAGVFKIPSEIFITHTKKNDIQDIKNFYKYVYQNEINFHEHKDKIFKIF